MRPSWERYVFGFGAQTAVFGLVGPVIGAAIFIAVSGAIAGHPMTILDLGSLSLPVAIAASFIYGLRPALIVGCVVALSSGFVRSEAWIALVAMLAGSLVYGDTILMIAEPPLNLAPMNWLLAGAVVLVATGAGAGLVCALLTRGVRRWQRRWSIDVVKIPRLANDRLSGRDQMLRLPKP